ncbi:MAG TPA: hypothetical protein VKA77_05180 [Mycobacterium sp.]|nr:hypothetical protein [Mycobacterium sp.]
MTTSWQMLLDDHGLRPGAVTAAACLAVLAGCMTLVVSVVVVGALFPSGLTDPGMIVAWLVAGTQVAGAVPLMVGGVRLALGTGRKGVVAGAGMLLLVCGAYFLYGVIVVSKDDTEGPSGPILFSAVAGSFAVLTVGSLALSLSRSATEYLGLPRRPIRSFRHFETASSEPVTDRRLR